MAAATSVRIDALATSAYADAAPNLKSLIDTMTQQVAAGANWMVRKKTVCDLMLALDSVLLMPPEERTQHGVSPDGDPPLDSQQAARLLSVYIGAILERLGETHIVGAEQAAIYLLSSHDEHHVAAQRWMAETPRNMKAVRKIAREDQRYSTLLDRIDEGADDDDDDEDE